MANVLIFLGILLVLPWNFFQSVNSYKSEEKQYADLIRRLRYLAQERNHESYDDYLQQRYRAKIKKLHSEEIQPVEKVKDVERDENEIEKDVLLDAESKDSQTDTTAPSPETTTTNKAPLPPLPQVQTHHKDGSSDIARTSDMLFIGIVAACSLAGFVGLIMAGVCWYKLNKNIKAASEVDYPAYGVTGPTKERLGSGPGDRKLAQSAQMYHYQHQKQQMIAMEKANGEMKHDASEDESEEENEEGDYTVYECPGLAPTGEMEVRNPLFNEETPVSKGPGDDHTDTQ